MKKKRVYIVYFPQHNQNKRMYAGVCKSLRKARKLRDYLLKIMNERIEIGILDEEELKRIFKNQID